MPGLSMRNTWSLSGIFLLIMAAVLWGADQQVVVSDPGPVIAISKDSLFDTFEAGGPVMWPILLCSLVGLAFGIERWMGLRRGQILPEELEASYREAMEGLSSGKKKPEEVFKMLSSGGSSEGAMLFDRYMRREFSNIRDLEQVLQEYVEVTQWNLQRNVKPIGVVVQVSPLLGLFGTVLGMIEAFNVVAEKGLGKPELLASGMAVALLTTGFGLGVAIPFSLVHHFLLERASQMSLTLYNMLHELSLELCGGSKTRPS